jgi:energy-coupling factor transporter ATP-binding protein EcfA2
MTSNSFNVFDELSTWAKTLPPWQHCLLSKLVSAPQLSHGDLDLIFRELLVDFDLAAADGGRAIYEIAVPQFANDSKEAPPYLATIDNVSGVNALMPGEELTFGPKLNVVYGPNGSGKSGYSRLLKAACYTRSHETKILGNIQIAPSERPIPSARFTLADGAIEDFVYRHPCPRLRDNFAVFDSSCVRVHLDERNAIEVMPYLFDVFPRMIEVFDQLQSMLRQSIAAKSPPPDRFVIPNSNSSVAQALAMISAKTDLDSLSELASFGEAESTQLESVLKQIAELRSTDPKQLIKQNQQRIMDLESLVLALTEAASCVNKTVVADVSDEIETQLNLRAKAAAMAAAQFGTEPLQPIGTSAWRALIEAAIAYHMQAYPGNEFPAAQSAAPRCVLCQQELDTESRDRLERFYNVATSEVETQAKKSQSALNQRNSALAKLSASFFSPESVAWRTVKELAPGLEISIESLVAKIDGTRAKLLEAIANLVAPACDSLTDKVSNNIEALAKRLSAENEVLKTKDTTDLLKPLLAEQQLLEDRKALVGKHAAVLAAVNDLVWAEKATAVTRKFPTLQREVTTKQKELTTSLVAKGYIGRFSENCSALKLKTPIRLRFAGESGTTDRQIEIVNADSKTHNFEPSEILSEGEQTATALADFLTEVELSGSCAGVVFDDPVTSMDHIRKESIAQRLVVEAKTRQVIIFTHDILFTNYLALAAKADAVSFKAHTVWRDNQDAPGKIDLLAFPHEHYEGAAFNRAAEYFERAKLSSGDSQHDALEHCCSSLRTAYEDFVQSQLFGDVVGRWRENIKYKLNEVYYDESIANRVQVRLEGLSRFIEAHSHSQEYRQVPLTTDIMRDEISEFERLKAEYKAARKVWVKARGGSEFS